MLPFDGPSSKMEAVISNDTSSRRTMRDEPHESLHIDCGLASGRELNPVRSDLDHSEQVTGKLIVQDLVEIEPRQVIFQTSNA